MSIQNQDNPPKKMHSYIYRSSLPPFEVSCVWYGLNSLRRPWLCSFESNYCSLDIYSTPHKTIHQATIAFEYKWFPILYACPIFHHHPFGKGVSHLLSPVHYKDSPKDYIAAWLTIIHPMMVWFLVNKCNAFLK